MTAPSAQIKLLANIATVYDHKVRECGPTAKAAFWKSKEHQERRFGILCEIFDDVDLAGGLTLHDFGCGYGALFDYLKNTEVMQRSRYIGTDMSKEMYEAASARIDDPRASFVRHLKAVEMADYTFVCGTFNMHMATNELAWSDYVKTTLKQLWSKTRKGLAFNMLRPDAEEQYHTLFYADPLDFFNFCSTHMSSKVTYRAVPSLPDWTMFVRR